MAENKTKPTKVSVAEFLAKVPDPVKRADAKTLVALMQAATGEKAKMWGPSIVGFGQYHYVYESGREGDMPLICFSPRKPATVIYVTTKFAGADALFAKLGKYKLSGGCLHVKKLADLDPKALAALIAKSIAATRRKHPT